MEPTLTLLDPLGLLVLLPIAGMAWPVLRRRPVLRSEVQALLVRSFVLVLLALSAAGLQVRLASEGVGLAVVLDRSASVPEANRAIALSVLSELRDAQGPDDALAVVVAADGARVVQEGGGEGSVGEVPIPPDESDLAAGLRLAQGLLPDLPTRRVLLLSDGEETRGDARTEAALLGGEAEVWTLPLSARADGPEVLLSAMQAPDRVVEGEAFTLRVVAEASGPAEGVLRLWEGDRQTLSEPVRLEPGSQVLSLSRAGEAAGFLRFRAIWEAAPGTDTVAQNNVAVATVAVSGRPRVLLVEGPGTDASAVTQALQARRFLVDRRSAEDLPGALPALLPYAVVLLADVPAYAVTTRQMEALRHWVGDLGRGLVMLGGDESFGLGGWYRTPVEEVLPVRCDIQDHRIFPSLGLVEAVDKSGSMGGLGAAEKLGMAKEAAIQSMEIMSPTDRFGLVAFDAAATWEVPMTDLRDRRPVRDRIARLQPGGGTDIYPALVEAYGALAREQTAQKHIVLLSDGVTQGADFQALIRLGQKRGVSLSAVAFGEDADAASMRQWARWGAGRSYVVTRPEQVPRIFTREAMMASRSFLVEEPFVPRLGAPDPVTEGLLDVLPPLLGFVLTESRPRARVALTAPGPGGVRVPLLATWRYGLGRTAAWTSDVEPRWARHWLGQPVMERLLGQLVEWLAGVAQADVQARASLDGGRLHVEVDALGPDGSFLDGARGTARVLAPDLSVTELPLHQRGPGRYEAEAPAPAPGTWLVAVALEDARGASIGQATAEASRAWSPEYQPGRDGEPLLHDVARLGGGEVLTGPELERIWARSASPRLVPRSLVPWLLAAALLLWVLDAAARRLAWGSGRWDVAPSAAAAPSLASGPRQAAPPLPSRPPTVPAEAPPLPSVTVPDPPPAARDAYVGGLLNARQRARNRAAGGGDPGTGRG